MPPFFTGFGRFFPVISEVAAAVMTAFFARLRSFLRILCEITGTTAMLSHKYLSSTKTKE